MTCALDDITVLAGLNNTGKTSVLQGIYLLASVLPQIHDHPNIVHSDIQSRAFDLNPSIAKLGLLSFDSLLQGSEIPFKLTGAFPDGLSVSIEMAGRGRFCFTLLVGGQPIDQTTAKSRVSSLRSLAAEFFRPPGMLSAHEVMLSGDDYRGHVAQGRGNQYWRNSIWWGVQSGGGPEAFDFVRKLVNKHFPDVTLLQPTLGENGNPPPILINYREQWPSPLDIAQSGSGLHTFLSLAQLVEQSKANIILLDEPDSHLHASQQTIVVDLLTDLATDGNRQVILATHAPEILARVPQDSIRWIERDSPIAEGGIETATMLDRLGASPSVYLSKSSFPEVIVYVEGDDDKPIIERLIKYCKQRSESQLPSSKVIRHKDGKFDAMALQGIVRTARELNNYPRVIGIRDLDWNYTDCGLPPPDEMHRRQGEGYVLLTLPCKEIENLSCDVDTLFEALKRSLPRETLQRIVEEESLATGLIDEWRYHSEPQIRDRSEPKIDHHIREKRAEEEFQKWSTDWRIRSRLISGKALLGLIRVRLHKDHGIRLTPTSIFETKENLCSHWGDIATEIFPEMVVAP